MLIAGSCLVLLACLPAQAARVENLFSAEVVVEDTSEEVREAGIKTAFGKVLVRVTGSRAAALRPELLGLAETSASLVQAFRYRRDNGAVILTVAFDGEATQQRVRSLGVPVWGAERPAVLVLVAVDYGGGRRSVLAADSEGQAAETIRAAALERGLPVNLPLMDAQDRERMSFGDIWGGFLESLDAAAERYSPDALLIGRARRLAGGGLSVDWRLQFGAEVLSERGGLGDGVEIAADYFARQFSVGGDSVSAQDVTLEVAELGTLKSYASVMRHLRGLPVIENFELTGLAGDSAFFKLRLRGSQEQLRRALLLGGVMQERRLSPIEASQAQGANLRYRPIP